MKANSVLFHICENTESMKRSHPEKLNIDLQLNISHIHNPYLFAFSIFLVIRS